MEIIVEEDVADGIYSNMVVVNQTISEFVLDFISILPGAKRSKVKSRVVLTPVHAKRLFNILGDSLEKFEEEFGTINDKENLHTVPLNFPSIGEA